jgi:hypothetical protein
VTDSSFPSPRTVPRLFGRRRFLQGSALSVVAVACSSGEPEATIQVVALFSPDRVIAAGRPQRIPFGLVDDERLSLDDVPLMVRVLRDGQLVEETTVLGRVVTHDHSPGAEGESHQHANLLRYYALRTILPDVGVYDINIDVEGHTVTLPVQAFDPGDISLPLVGDRFPSIETPTLDDARGVDPICTLFDGPCPFHTRTAADVIAAGDPMAFLVATPAFCATSYCGPVLGTLIDSAAAFPTIAMVHVEPFANPREGVGLSDPNLRTSPSVDSLGLAFEPSLFLVDRTGRIAERIDNVFDANELDAALTSIA